jgi:hypothetical protein
MVEERVDGTRQITHHDRPLDYHPIPVRPKRVAEPSKQGPSPSASGQANSSSSVAHTAAADTRHTRGSGPHINRTFLLWEKEDMSTVA